MLVVIIEMISPGGWGRLRGGGRALWHHYRCRRFARCGIAWRLHIVSPALHRRGANDWRGSHRTRLVIIHRCIADDRCPTLHGLYRSHYRIGRMDLNRMTIVHGIRLVIPGGHRRANSIVFRILRGGRSEIGLICVMSGSVPVVVAGQIASGWLVVWHR